MTRTVLITGSDGHLGRALREAFEAQGDEVTRVDKFEFDDQNVSYPMPDGRWLTDLEKPYLGEGLAKKLGPHDVVVCNAKVKSWEAHERLARLATSSIINIGSIYGVLGNDPSMYIGTEVDPTPAWYAASKGALIALTKWQACNLAPVRSNCVCPGGIERGHSDEFKARYAAKSPLGRMATESDIVPLVLFLADPLRSAYITGQVICVDGGLSVMA